VWAGSPGLDDGIASGSSLVNGEALCVGCSNARPNQTWLIRLRHAPQGTVFTSDPSQAWLVCWFLRSPTMEEVAWMEAMEAAEAEGGAAASMVNTTSLAAASSAAPTATEEAHRLGEWPIQLNAERVEAAERAREEVLAETAAGKVGKVTPTEARAKAPIRPPRRTTPPLRLPPPHSRPPRHLKEPRSSATANAKSREADAERTCVPTPGVGGGPPGRVKGCVTGCSAARRVMYVCLQTLCLPHRLSRCVSRRVFLMGEAGGASRYEILKTTDPTTAEWQKTAMQWLERKAARKAPRASPTSTPTASPTLRLTPSPTPIRSPPPPSPSPPPPPPPSPSPPPGWRRVCGQTCWWEGPKPPPAPRDAAARLRGVQVTHPSKSLPRV
jgi:hypothetical protein